MRYANRTMCLALVFASSLCSATSAAAGDPPVVEFQSEAWTISRGSQIVEHLGREALAGSASLEGVEFTDGVIEVDIAMNGRVSFSNFRFSIDGDLDFGPQPIRAFTPGGLGDWEISQVIGRVRARLGSCQRAACSESPRL